METSSWFTVAPNDSRAERTAVLGGKISVKVSGQDTSGAWVLFEIPTAPNAGPPLHLHRAQDEWFYVLAGEHEFRVGSENCRVDAGGSIFCPRQVPHTWQNIGTNPGKMLALGQPAGQLEQFFASFGQLIAGPSPDHASICRLFAAYEMEVVGPPLDNSRL
jgi:quercetin dioxygenase-like cupin family protein